VTKKDDKKIAAKVAGRLIDPDWKLCMFCGEDVDEATMVKCSGCGAEGCFACVDGDPAQCPDCWDEFCREEEED